MFAYRDLRCNIVCKVLSLLKTFCVRTGACFIYMAGNIDEWLPETRKPDILNLVSVFLFMKILTVTLDMVVDGWALTMLKRSVLLLNISLF